MSRPRKERIEGHKFIVHGICRTCSKRTHLDREHRICSRDGMKVIMGLVRA